MLSVSENNNQKGEVSANVKQESTGQGSVTLCDQVCEWFATGQWFSPNTRVSSTNKTDRHDIAEIFLKVALNTINQPKIVWVDHSDNDAIAQRKIMYIFMYM